MYIILRTQLVQMACDNDANYNCNVLMYTNNYYEYQMELFKLFFYYTLNKNILS